MSAVASEVTGTVNTTPGATSTTTGAITITSTASDPAQAQAVAAAYAQAFINQTEATVQSQVNKIADSMASISQQISTLQSQPSSTVTTAKIQGLTTTLGTLQTEQTTILTGEPYATVEVAANFPTAPTGLSGSKLAAIGIVAGLIVGCGVALGRERFDTRLRTTWGVEEITESPVLAELPLDDDVRSGKVSIALVQAPHSPMSEALRELRTSLRVLLDDVPCPLIVVTSPEAGDGKTFITANLAASWALSGNKVIVVSADFRRPRLEELLGVEASGLPGLSDLIVSNWKQPEHGTVTPDGVERTTRDRDRTGGRVPQRHPEESSSRRSSSRPAGSVEGRPDSSSVSSVLLDGGTYGLQVLPAGTRLEDPAELFGSPGIRPVLDQLPLLADVVLFDSPPVLAVPDTAILGGLATGSVVVASQGRTERTGLERTIHRLEATHCSVLGVAVNRTRRSTPDRYQAYAYQE